MDGQGENLIESEDGNILSGREGASKPLPKGVKRKQKQGGGVKDGKTRLEIERQGRAAESEMEDAGLLKDLGVDVYDQTRFEEGVIGQIETAIAAEEVEGLKIELGKLEEINDKVDGEKQLAIEKRKEFIVKRIAELQNGTGCKNADVEEIGGAASVLGSSKLIEEEDAYLDDVEFEGEEDYVARKGKAPLRKKKQKEKKVAPPAKKMFSTPPVRKAAQKKVLIEEEDSDSFLEDEEEYRPDEDKESDADVEIVSEEEEEEEIEYNTTANSGGDDSDDWKYEERVSKWLDQRENERRVRQQNIVKEEYMSFEERLEKEEFGKGPIRDAILSDGFRVPGEIWVKLFKFQRVTMKWLWVLHSQNAGGILGDEMGLGKTVQMIAFLVGLRYSSGISESIVRKKLCRPILIVCPATVMRQWMSEFHKWWPPFRIVIFHGAGISAEEKRARLLDSYTGTTNVFVTTYTTVRLYQADLLNVNWNYVVLDEGHKIRNPDAAVTLVCKQFRTAHRIILSGSPIQNSLNELWSLYDFVFPGKLGTLPVFLAQFAIPINNGGYANASSVQVQTAYKCACVLRDVINPYLLRRLKQDVKLELPEKKEQILFCKLTPHQRRIYKQIIESRAVEQILSGERQIFYGIFLLRKLCNHPALLVRDSLKYLKGVKKESLLAKKGEESEKKKKPWKKKKRTYADRVKEKVASRSVYGVEENDFKEAIDGDGDGEDEEEEIFEEPLPFDGEQVECEWMQSGKMLVVDSLLRMWYDQKHRVLLFSQTRQMLDLIEAFVVEKGYTFRRMDGNTNINQRQALIDEFNKRKDIFVFLLTTKVGGLGVNLMGANRVVIYDPDWNPSTDNQAMERAWRIGQTKNVTVYRLLTAGTIEEKIYHRQIFKQFLTNRVLKDPKQKRFFKSNDLYELFTLGSDGVETTETGAIFSGTGSEIEKKEVVVESEEEKEEEEETIGNVARVSNLKDIPSERSSPVSVVDSEPSSSFSAKGKSAMVLDRKRKSENDEANAVKIRKAKKSGKDDDLILEELFKSAGIHSALKHDTIVDSANQETILVEKEAERIAKEAADALKLSRQACRQMSVSTPTWTGKSGLSGAQSQPKKRFGQVSSSRILPKKNNMFQQKELNTTNHNTMDPNVPRHIRQLMATEEGPTQSTSTFFGGEGDEARGLLKSFKILRKMQSRNRNSKHLHVSTEEEDNQRKHIIDELRKFIASKGGICPTQDIVDQFKLKLDKGDTAVFRAMLQQIAQFIRRDGQGMWKIKDEFL
eukprot:Nk52_evm42s1401 gene=Nk52_evmTU42s1401